MRKYGPADFKVMPWKNGGGSTTELLIHPPGATLDGGFLWRLSMAEVGVSGPFSSFPGVDRSLMLLSGRMELEHAGHGRQRLDEALKPVSFSGDWTTVGTLLDGPCRDFNVMSARGKLRHELSVLKVEGSAVLPSADRGVVVCLEGEVELQGACLVEGDLLVLGATSDPSARGRAVLAIVAIHEVPSYSSSSL